MITTYTVFATGLDSADGAPSPGFAVGGRATFGMSSEDWAVLPELRRWIASRGGEVVNETGSPAPVENLDEGGLYAVSLGPSEDIAVQGVRRVDTDCEECGLPVLRLHRDTPTARATATPKRPVVSTVAACWLARPDLVSGAGVETVPVETLGGSWTGCWPGRLLAGHPLAGSPCGTCLAVARVPTYSLGLLVERPDDPSGWWWYSRMGQHLPVLSGDLVARLREHVELSALPLLTDPATAFLPEELR